MLAAAVVARVRENPAHVAALKAHFGADVFADTATAMAFLMPAPLRGWRIMVSPNMDQWTGQPDG